MRVEVAVVMVCALVLMGVLVLAVGRHQLDILARHDNAQRVALAREQVVRPGFHIRAVIDEHIRLFEVLEVVRGRFPVVRLGSGGDHVRDVYEVTADFAGEVVHGVEARQHAQLSVRVRVGFGGRAAAGEQRE